MLGPVLVNYIRQYQIDHGIAKAQAYNTTLYILAGLLVVGLICNLMVKPVDPRFHMKPDAQGQPWRRRHAAESRQQRPLAAATSSPLGLFLAWALVGIPLLWGVYQTLLNAMKLFK